jgi:NAD(P)H-hydrate repair Nnr-like enzyme with NAD(P)H-hydrate dehydratase domain
METSKAAVIAARVNRLAGNYTMPTPATQILDIIENIPRALDLVLNSAERFDTVKNIE